MRSEPPKPHPTASNHGYIPITWEELRERVSGLPKFKKALDIYEELMIEVWQEGYMQGFKEGYALKTKEVVMSLLENFPDQPDEKFAKVAKVDMQYVQQIRLEMKKAKKPSGRTKQ